MTSNLLLMSIFGCLLLYYGMILIVIYLIMLLHIFMFEIQLFLFGLQLFGYLSHTFMFSWTPHHCATAPCQISVGWYDVSMLACTRLFTNKIKSMVQGHNLWHTYTMWYFVRHFQHRNEIKSLTSTVHNSFVPIVDKVRIELCPGKAHL